MALLSAEIHNESSLSDTGYTSPVLSRKMYTQGFERRKVNKRTINKEAWVAFKESGEAPGTVEGRRGHGGELGYRGSTTVRACTIRKRTIQEQLWPLTDDRVTVGLWPSGRVWRGDLTSLSPYLVISNQCYFPIEQIQIWKPQGK